LEPGHTLALDLPYHPARTPALCRQLDRILLDHGGRLYLAKDSLTDAETFRAMYPRLREFQAVKRRVDPDGRFVSSQALRVGIVERRGGRRDDASGVGRPPVRTKQRKPTPR
jgi:decaprenylphospho-beta-D-ribofuranose 2-oxidase